MCPKPIHELNMKKTVENATATWNENANRQKMKEHLVATDVTAAGFGGMRAVWQTWPT